MLKDITVVRKTVKVGPKHQFKVRGLTLSDLGSLIEENFDAINQLMEGQLDLRAIQEVYPEFTAKIIALAADEPDCIDTVKTLPFPVQLLALEKCWDLTVPDYDALGKLIERIKGFIPKLPAKQA